MLSYLSSGELMWLSAFIALFLLFVVVLGWASIQSSRDDSARGRHFG
jgi:hypothetical protein